MKRKLKKGSFIYLLTCSENKFLLENNYFNIIIYKSIILSYRFTLQLWLSRKFCDANKWFKIKKGLETFQPIVKV